MSEKVINTLLKRISDLEFENERLEHIIEALENGIIGNIEELEEFQLSRDRIDEDKNILRFLQELKKGGRTDENEHELQIYASRER